MRRRIASFVTLCTTAVLLASCGDASRTTSPASPIRPENGRLNTTTATCLTYTQLVSLVNDVFGAGSPNANSALGKLDNLNKQIQKGSVSDAQTQAIVNEMGPKFDRDLPVDAIETAVAEIDQLLRGNPKRPMRAGKKAS